ncbi:MAG: hypothetical protein WC046_05665 [Candidatus Bathyarchaeia archaeon]
MPKPRLYSPLKIGVLIFSFAYFLFTFRAMFRLSWIGEWAAFSGSLRLIILVEDVSAAIGVAFKLAASAIALGTVILYFLALCYLGVNCATARYPILNYLSGKSA